MEILPVLKGDLIPTIPVIGGIALLWLSIVSLLGGKITVVNEWQPVFMGAGLVPLLAGIGLYLALPGTYL